jgi:transposase-like protein
MKKSEIESYMDAYMEGFWQCYCVMFDLIEDDDLSQEEANSSQEIVKDSSEIKRKILEAKPLEVPYVEPDQTKPKTSKIQKIDRGKVCALLDAGWKVSKIAGEMGVSEPTIYNIQKQHREEKAKQETQA